VRGRVDGGNDDESRDHREDGQGSEAHGPLHEFEFLAGPVKVLEPEVAAAWRTARWTTVAATSAT
jgi:hypothetical protein